MTPCPESPEDARVGYPDIYTPEVLAALEALSPLDARRYELMAQRIARRAERARDRRPIEFLPEDAIIDGTSITVADARAGRFEGAVIPHDLQRQWIQGTGPATKPRSSTASGLRNVAYAMLSGADGWMFDGEDALGQIETMSLDNQRNLKLMIAEDPQFLSVAEQVAGEMNAWAEGFFGHATIARLARAAPRDHEDLPRARAAPGRPAHRPRRRPRVLGVDRRPRSLRDEQPRRVG